MNLTDKRNPLSACARFFRSVLLILVFFLGLLGRSPAQNQKTSGRPILFTHGFYGDSAGWGDSKDPATFRGFVVNSLAIYDNTDYSNTTNYDLYFDLQTGSVLWDEFGDPTKDPPAIGNVPHSARFFTIVFNSWSASNLFDKYAVANVSILNKAYELSQVIKAIAAITHVQDVIIIGHSQGGLVARAYVEQLGSLFPCVDTAYAPPCTPGQIQYTADVAHILSLDTPHGGGDFTNYYYYFLLQGQVPPLDLYELMTASSVLQALNYKGEIGNTWATDLPSTLTIDSIESYFSDLPYQCPGSQSVCYSDAVVDSVSQAIRENIDQSKLSPRLTDIGNPIASTDPQIKALEPLNCPPDPLMGSTGAWLHLISCTGGVVNNTQNFSFDSISKHLQGNLTSINIQATYNGSAWTGAVAYQLSGPNGVQSESSVPTTLTDLPLGTYSVSYLSGGPASVGPPFIVATPGPTLQSGQWAITFTMQFSSQTSQVNTLPATSVTGSAAVLNGSINPEGANGNYDFEWGTDPTMSTYNEVYCSIVYNPYSCPSVTANFSTQFESGSLSRLANSTTYYFRLVFYDANTATYLYGSVASFTTGKPPVVTTTAATSVTGSSAVLNGTINPLGANNSWDLEWGTDPTMSSYNEVYCSIIYNPYACPSVTPNSTTQSVNGSVSRLPNNKTYYFRLVAYDEDNGSYWYGKVLKFTTGKPPVVTTTAATSVTGSSAVLNGTINPLGANNNWDLEWGTDPTMSTYNEVYCSIIYNPYSCPSATPNSTTQSVNGSVSRLPNNTTYYFRLVVFDVDNGTYWYGKVQKFTTGKPPAVTTTAATSVTGSSAVLNGTINPLGANNSWDLEWGTDPTMSSYNEVYCSIIYNPYACPSVTPNSTTQSVSGNISGLSGSTTYYFRLVVFDEDNGSYWYGGTLSFTTP